MRRCERLRVTSTYQNAVYNALSMRSHMMAPEQPAKHATSVTRAFQTFSGHEILAPPPQNRRSTSRVQNWGCCLFCLFSYVPTNRTPHTPQKYHPMRKVSCGDGAWFAVPYPFQPASKYHTKGCSRSSVDSPGARTLVLAAFEPFLGANSGVNSANMLLCDALALSHF